MTSTAASSQPHTGSVRPSKSLHPCLNVLTCKIEIVLSGYSFIHFLIVNQSRALNNPFTTKHYALSKKPSGSQQQVFLPTSARPTNPASSCWPHTSGFYTFSEFLFPLTVPLVFAQAQSLVLPLFRCPESPSLGSTSVSL